MPMRMFLLPLLLAVMFCCIPALAAAHPNVVIIMADDLGYGDVGVYGSAIRTPNIDRLAREGLRLTDYYCAAPNCSPSRAGLLTGRTPSRIGIYDYIDPGSPMHLPPGEVTIAEMLKPLGYATCHVGKWHLSSWARAPEAPLASPTPGEQGFDYWFAVDNNAVPSHLDPTNFIRNGENLGELKGYSCQLVADEAIAWLRKRKDVEQPFYLNVWFNEPHKKIASPTDIIETYDGIDKDDAHYFANVTNMDDAVGRILSGIDEIGERHNTLVIFTSDNGPWRKASSGGLRAQKSSLYEGGIRVPGIIRWPAVIAASRESNVPVGAVDVLPTLADILELEIGEERVIDGQSVLPLLKGEPFARTKPLFWLFYKSTPMCVLRKGNLSLAGNPATTYRSPSHPFDQTDFDYLKRATMEKFELYDLSRDPGQMEDVSAQFPKIVQELAEMMNSIHAEVIDQGPIWRGLWKE